MGPHRILIAEHDRPLPAGLRDALETMGYDVTVVVRVEPAGRAPPERRGSETHERWIATLSSVGEGVVAIDPDARVTFLNAEAVRLIGPAAATGQDVRRFLRFEIEETGAAIRLPLLRALQTGRTVTLPPGALLVREDGERIPVSDRASPILLNGSEPAGAVMVFRDLRQARLTAKTLRPREGHHRRLFQSSPIPVYIGTISDGRILEVNESFLELFAYRREEVVGRREGELGLWVEDGAREDLLLRTSQRGPGHGLETRLRANTQEIREVDLYAEMLEMDGEACILVMIHDLTERVAFERELERLALEDVLTGLPNRRLFQDHLTQALARSRHEGGDVAVLFMDLDRFKVVNDTLGHVAGDQALREVARRLRECFGEEDTLARLGGDEFAALLPRPGAAGQIEEVARHVIHALGPPLDAAGTPVHLGVSIGIASSAGEDLSGEDLLRFSDIAMFRAKQRGGGSFYVYDPVLDTAETQRLHRENQLRQAIAREEISLRFHPIVELGSGRIVGAEVLARWDHPDRGTLLPADFIPTAEETGLIVPLGESILRKACRILTEWNRLVPDPSPFTLSVNLSGRQFVRPDFIAEIGSVLKDEGTDPNRLQVELTESTVMHALGRVRKLKSLGLRLAVDDFGTGYSPFTYLKELEVDALKIDRSFVHGITVSNADAVITRTILQFAEGLGLNVVAEGVETAGQRQALLGYGCRLAQGFLFARPLRAAEFEKLLGNGNGQGRRPTG